MPTTPQPNITDFRTFIVNVMGIPTAQLPSDSPIIQHAYDFALATVNIDLNQIPSQPTSYTPYAMAVYNLGGHSLIEFAPDQVWPVIAAAWGNGVVTATTGTPHSLAPGNTVNVGGLSPLAYDGQFVVQAVPTPTQFAYNVRTPGQANATVIAAGATVTEYFFARLRSQWKLASFAPGVVASSSDVSTSASLINPEFFANLRLLDLQLLKTPFGRRYLELAQAYGPVIWGLS